MLVGAPAKKLTLAGDRCFAGNASGKFEVAKPFVFPPATDGLPHPLVAMSERLR